MNQNQIPPQIIEARIKLYRAKMPHVLYRGEIFILNIPNCLAVIKPLGMGVKLETTFTTYTNEDHLRRLKDEVNNRVFTVLTAVREVPELEEVKGGKL
jgi:hypothetical protein